LIEPNPRLIDYLESAQIIVTWKEWKAFPREEENAAYLAELQGRWVSAKLTLNRGCGACVEKKGS
jgi:hypothetical protein